VRKPPVGVYEPTAMCDWTAVKAEDKRISRWGTKRMERLHTVSLYGRAGPEEKPDGDDDGIQNCLTS